MASIEVLEKTCIGCGACVRACPYDAITMQNKLAVIDLEKCTLCGSCVKACPVDAILIPHDHRPKMDISEYKDVWVFAEQKEGKIQSVAFELLGAGQKLADARKCELCAILIGKNMNAQTKELIMRGANKVYLAEHESLEDFNDEPYTEIMIKAIQKYKPEIVLAGATVIGRSLIPRVATKLGTGLTADCTGLEIDPDSGHLLQTRPAFGGNIMATIRCENYRPQMATVRHKVMDEPEPDTSKSGGEVISLDISAANLVSGTKVLEVIREVEETINIMEADVIVAGGRGMKGPEHFNMLKDLAKVLNGAVGASRAAVDAGWVNLSHQVGQTGKTVKPKVYIACGISGAIQHLVGMSSSDVIIAINKNPDAPIFEVASYALVGDLFEIVPELIKRFKEIRKA